MKTQPLIYSLMALASASLALAAPEPPQPQKQSPGAAGGTTTSTPHEEGSSEGGASDFNNGGLTGSQLNLFRQIDRNGDGVISKAEFARFLAANPDSGLRLTEGAASNWTEPPGSRNATPTPASKPWAPPVQHGGNDDAGPQSHGDTRDSAGRPAR